MAGETPAVPGKKNHDPRKTRNHTNLLVLIRVFRGLFFGFALKTRFIAAIEARLLVHKQ